MLLSTPFVLFILAINIIVDSGSIIKDRGAEIAKILASGKNAGIKFIPSDLGSLQTALVQEQKKKNAPAKDILVFGSSRASEICANIFPKNTFYNCAIPGAHILDYIALYGLYKQNKMLPKYLLISIDPWTFHSRKTITVKKELIYVADTSTALIIKKGFLSDYKNGLSYLGFKDDSPADKRNYSGLFQNMIGLFNLNYFQLNLKSSFSKMVVETNRDYLNSYFIIRNDGSYSLAAHHEIDSNWVIKKSKINIDIQKSNFFIPQDTSTIYFEYFKKLLISLKNDGVTPIVYISPVNPIIFDGLSDSMNVELENTIAAFCKQNSIVVIGSFNPHKYGYNYVANFFIDDVHPIKSVVYNIFNFHKNELKTIGINQINQLSPDTKKDKP